MKFKNEKRMISFVKKLLVGAKVLNNKIETPDLSVRNFILVDLRINYLGHDIIFEYNGPHHYQPHNYSNKTLEEAKQDFKNQKKRDEWLRSYCKANNIYLVEIDGRVISKENIKIFLATKFSKFGLPFKII